MSIEGHEMTFALKIKKCLHSLAERFGLLKYFDRLHETLNMKNLKFRTYFIFCDLNVYINGFGMSQNDLHLKNEKCCIFCC